MIAYQMTDVCPNRWEEPMNRLEWETHTLGRGRGPLKEHKNIRCFYCSHNLDGNEKSNRLELFASEERLEKVCKIFIHDIQA